MPDSSARYFFTTNNLGAEIDERSDVECISGEDNKVETAVRR